MGKEQNEKEAIEEGTVKNLIAQEVELPEAEMRIAKKFPSYFENFEIPEWAREQEIEVYRACATGKVDQLSF